jgi:hypothetical protein
MSIVSLLVLSSVREWWLILSKRKTPFLHEAPYVESEYATGA